MKKGRLLTGIVAVGVVGTAAILANGEEARYTPLSTSDNVEAIAGAAEYLHMLRANPETGEVSLAEVMAARTQAQNMPSSKTLNLQWESLGPANAGGRARAMLIDKDSSNIVYAGSVSGGLFRSRTGGSSWEVVSDPMSNLAVVSITQAANGDIYYGTGEWPFISYGGGGAASTPAFIGGGIYKSTDNGKTFSVLQSTQPSSNTPNDNWSAVGDMGADPTDGNVIYAATPAGVRKTTDGGTTWTVVMSGFCRDLFVDQNGAVYADVGNRLMFSSSGDAGTFNELSTGAGGAGTLPRSGGRMRIAVSPQDANYIYVVQLQGSALKAVYRSIDGGSTWTQIGQKGQQFDPMCSGTRCQGTYDLLFAVSAKDKDRIWMGGITLWTWKAGQWSQVNTTGSSPGNPFYIHSDVHEIISDPKNPDVIWCATDGGLFKSNDHGVTWVERNLEFRTLQFYKFGVGEDRSLIGGTQDNGTQLMDGSQNFSNYATRVLINGAQADGGEADISWLSPKVMFGENQNGDLGRSENSGESFARFFEGNMLAGAQPFNGAFSNWIMPYELYETTNDPLSTDSVLFYAFPASQSLGFGNGTDVSFSSTLARPYAPAVFQAGSFRIVSGGLTVTSDAAGNLSGDGTGTFDASTGAYSVTFNQAPLAEIVISCDVSYPAGSEISLASNIAALPYNYTLPVTVNPDDSLMVQDPVQSMLITGLTSYDSFGGRVTGGIWMTREAHNFSKTPNWFKIGQLNNGETPLSMTISADGDICYIGTTSGNVWRLSNINAARSDSDDILLNPNSNPTVDVDMIRSFGGTVTDVAVDPNNNDRVLVTLGGYGNGARVYYSTNATGASPTFVAKHSNLPQMPVYCGLFDKNNPSTVIVGTELGVYSLDNIDGASPQWADENNGLPQVAVFEMEQYRTDKLSPDTANTVVDGDIYLATHGRGFFRTGSTTVNRPVSVEENELEFATREDLNVFPNPTRGNTNIQIDLTETVDVNVIVRDLNGKTVINRNMGRMSAGNHDIPMSMGWLNSGVYIISVEMGDRVQTGDRKSVV